MSLLELRHTTVYTFTPVIIHCKAVCLFWLFIVSVKLSTYENNQILLLNHRLLWQAWSVKWSHAEGNVSFSLSLSFVFSVTRETMSEGRGLMNTCLLPTSRLKCARLFPSGSDVSLFYRRSLLFQVWAQANDPGQWVKISEGKSVNSSLCFSLF